MDGMTTGGCEIRGLEYVLHVQAQGRGSSTTVYDIFLLSERPEHFKSCLGRQYSAGGDYRMKSVAKKLLFRSLTMTVMIFLFSSVCLAATRVRIEKARSASETERVPI
jgi:hypothetical protein